MLRHEVFVRRRGTSLSMSMQAGEQCAQIACEAGLFQSPSRIIACHVSMGTEISTIPLLSIALGCGYTVLVPKMGVDLDLGWGVLRSSTICCACMCLMRSPSIRWSRRCFRMRKRVARANRKARRTAGGAPDVFHGDCSRVARQSGRRAFGARRRLV